MDVRAGSLWRPSPHVVCAIGSGAQTNLTLSMCTEQEMQGS